MESVLVKIFDLYVLSGTMGTFAMLGVVLLIFAYFKYLKPLVASINEIKKDISNNSKNSKQIVELASYVKQQLRLQSKDMETRFTLVKTDLMEKIDLNSDDLGKTAENITLQIKEIAEEIEKISDEEMKKLNGLSIELTKLNLRMEMSQNFNQQLRGLK